MRGATAPGRVMRCDYAACDRPGTVEHDAWMFCDEHAKDGKTAGASTVKPAPKPVPAPTRPVAVQLPPPRTGPSARAATAPIGFGALLEQAAEHSNAKVRRLGDRIEKQLADLRDLVEALAEDERAKHEQAATQAQAKAEVERLQRELADAKAKLKPPRKTRTAGPARTAPTCTDCGTTLTRPAGTVGRWPSRCAECKAAA